MLSDRIKTIATVALVVLALLLGYIILFGNSNSRGSELADKDTFLESLSKTDNVFIIMDLRNITNKTIRNNIMQCGVDFAGSSGLANKTVITFAFEGEKCIGMNGTTTIKNCLEQSKKGVSLIIQNQIATTYYKNKAIVKVGTNYQKGACNIYVVQ